MQLVSATERNTTLDGRIDTSDPMPFGSGTRPALLIGEAREQAKEWVEREGSRTPGFVGAFLTGSTKWRPKSAIHYPSSDVDLRVVVDRSAPTVSWPKFRYRDILLEAAVTTRSELGSAEELLPNPHLAGSLWHPVLLADPAGELAELGRHVTAQFAKRRWVELRKNRARDLALLWLGRIDEAESFPEQVTCWLFGTGVTTFVPLTAGLRNLTVRRRYAESGALLEEYGRPDFHEEMLTWMGCSDMQAGRVSLHLQALADAFDAVGAHLDPSFRFAADLRSDARAVAIGGSQELIDLGLHREAVFWLVATFSRCLQGMRSDAPQSVLELCEAGFRDLLGDLGIVTPADLNDRADHTRAAFPRLEAVAEQIIEANPEIAD